jgi:hypothetical protein
MLCLLSNLGRVITLICALQLTLSAVEEKRLGAMQISKTYIAALLADLSIKAKV